MRLSEAIRLGAMSKPQAFGDTDGFAVGRSFTTQLFGRTEKVAELVPATCALGAAFEAVNATRVTQQRADTTPLRGEQVGEMVCVVKHPWVELTWVVATCPCCSKEDPIFRLIPHMNDDHKMTREAIASWLEPLEKHCAAAGMIVDPPISAEKA